MKIAVWHDLHSGGAKRVLFHHVEALVARGHDVEIWTPSMRDRDWAPLGTLAREHVRPLDYDDGWNLSERAGWHPRAHRLLAAMERHAQSCADEIATGGFDLLFANSSYRLAVSPIGRLTTLPSVLYLQEPWRFFYEAMPELVWAAPAPDAPWRTRWRDWRDTRSARLQAREEARNVRAYDRVLCNSYFSRESLLRAYGRDARVCYLGVDIAQFEPQAAPHDDYVVSLGAFSTWKNPRLCIEAVAAVPEAIRPPLVWVANVVDEEHRVEMMALAARLGVTFDLRVRVTDAELRALLGKARAMIYTSRLEPFGLAPLEANACGTPVVAVAEGGVRETVVDGVTGLLVDADAAAMAAALTRLTADPEFAARLGAQGRRIVEERWTSEAAGARLVDQLEAELARQRSA